MDSAGSLASGNNDGSNSPPTQGQKRQRAKQACEPCRLRKRRCDSAMPCNMCVSFQYRCYYEKHPRKRSKIVQANAEHDLSNNPDAYIRHEIAPEDRPGLEDSSTLRYMEANSGIAFTRLLGQRLDPGKGPALFTFGWNLGGRSAGTGSAGGADAAMDIGGLLNQDQMIALARLYFDNVHPLYGFMDKEYVLEQINVRWAQPSECRLPDHFFANMAGAGALFSDGSLEAVIPAIIDGAKKDLENSSVMQLPTLVDAQSWLMRCLYLRATEHPHAVHMASCILMHLVEALGLHQESRATPNVPDGDPNHASSVETRRRTFWIARMLNSWVSFEYGRTRVNLRGINTQLPTPQEGDYTTEYIHLYSLSCCLDPERDDSKWEDFLRQLEAYKTHHDGIELSRANLAMSGYRRLRLSNPTLSVETTARIIKLGLSGLEAAKRMAAKHMPWWHVANVPFQVVCVFLAMDVRESLLHVGAAIRVLEEVVERFRTAAMKEALKTARFLVRLSKKKKDEDSEVLGLSLKRDGEKGDAETATQKPETKVSTVHDVINGGAAYAGAPIPVGETPATASSSDDWTADLLNNSDLDWNIFLTADMPDLDGFAPDGMM
jgi:hypothetical protein